MKTKILVVDDEQKIREVISSYLQNQGYCALEARNGTEAIEIVNNERPDFMILDLMLPDMSGEEVCESIRRKFSIPILMLTAKVMEKDKIHGLSIGADDYMVKPFSPRELIMRVKTILRRTNDDLLLAERIAFNNKELVIDTANQEASFHGEIINLTPSEYKLLLVLARYPGRIYTREDLVEKVLGYDYEGETRIIDQHIKNLRHKIEANPKEPNYLITVYGIGYKFIGEKS